ncbi:hypothetical protein [Stigmatella aurantiaca]|uniref:Myxococcales GC_trans_RRR domain-containing protein n=1 Tax=Stigmatella aurantiaca (strain DW4/3-1) TaxID=378806 RepID=Q08RH3_STIAD|nr:hypothetical protein [Stigmatella aurantiaca]EAU63078.1 hypothetical protein STIAU_0936 [Stigmatella aurantiaca DW4/3-1]
MCGRKWLIRPSFLLRLAVVSGLLGYLPAAHAAPPVIQVNNGEPYYISERIVAPTSVSMSVVDPESEPVTVNASIIESSGVAALKVNVREQNGRYTLELTTGVVCEDTSYTVLITASDGHPGSKAEAQLIVWIIHTAPPPRPQLAVSNIVVKLGEDRQGRIEVQPPANPECELEEYEWKGITQGAPALVKDGRLAAIFTPPYAFLCDLGGKSYRYDVRVKDQAGLLSAPSSFLIQVKPWGKPLEAFPPGTGAFHLEPQPDLTLVGPSQRHACSLAPVDTVWRLVEGSLNREGLYVLDENGKKVAQPSVVTPYLQIRSEACVGTQLLFSVTNRMRDGSGLEGAASTCQVTIDPQWKSFGPGQLSLSESLTTSTYVSGVATTTNALDCVGQRGGVAARLRLTRVVDGTPVEGTSEEQTVEVPVEAPGAWRFDLKDNCEGSTYQVSGRLERNLDDWRSGNSQGPGEVGNDMEVLLEVTALPLDVILGPLEDSQLTISCGEAARGVLRQPLPTGPCSAADVVWAQEGGPALTQPLLRGQEVSVSTQEKDFGGLIGSHVALIVRANTPGGQPRRQTVGITAAPFVEVRRISENRSNSETNLFGVAVALRNTTACGVAEIQHVERLEGLDYVAGSARVDGAPVEVKWEGGALTVKGLALEGGATRTLTYVVRPHLLGQTRFTGGSSLRDIPISFDGEDEGPSGFGCEGAGPGIAGLGLAALAVALRHRRRSR